MRFEQALQAMREGKVVKIRNRFFLYTISDNKLCVLINYDKNKKDRIVDMGLLSREILSEDWEIVKYVAED